VELEDIARVVRSCEKCALHKGRKQAVPGTGDPHARIVFVGEAPGYWEDQKGEPFVGRAGKLLDEALASVGIKRREVFITNVVKCRPPDNRRPARGEVETCMPYLNMQLDTIAPRVIAPLGAVAGETIAKKYGLPWTGMMKENGVSREVMTILGKLTVLPVIHPAAVLRNPNNRGMLESAIGKLANIVTKK
jgi:uracil-DNA glycosylase